MASMQGGPDVGAERAPFDEARDAEHGGGLHVHDERSPTSVDAATVMPLVTGSPSNNAPVTVGSLAGAGGVGSRKGARGAGAEVELARAARSESTAEHATLIHVPASAGDVEAAHRSAGGRASRVKCLGVLSLVSVTAFALGVAALAIVLRIWRPEVQTTRSPASPSGYYYGGAVYQGSGTWIDKAALPSARSDLTATTVGDTVRVHACVRSGRGERSATSYHACGAHACPFACSVACRFI
ncbi:hypothetical protein EON68_00880 [archaeon]|nr:MAG: hypothetical protein EON68_00880 [archaeon]